MDGRYLKLAQDAAILRVLGVSELIAFDEGGYIRVTVRITADIGMRAPSVGAYEYKCTGRRHFLIHGSMPTEFPKPSEAC